MNYWNSTGSTGEEINDFYKQIVDDQLALLYLKEQEQLGKPINAVKMVTRNVLHLAHSVLPTLDEVKDLSNLFIHNLFIFGHMT